MKKPVITLEVLKEILPISSIEELRQFSLQVREDSAAYTSNELSEMLVLISNRLIELCDEEKKPG
jgi:hypothetical protein